MSAETQKFSNASGPMVCIDTERGTHYMGRMLVVPQKGHRICVGNRVVKVVEVRWDWNVGSFDWEVTLITSPA